jgi:hypothetical protein
MPSSDKPITNVRTERQNGVLVPVGKCVSLEDVANNGVENECLTPYEGGELRLYGKNNLQAAIATLISDAAEGNADARKELLDRVLGKPLQRQEIKSTNVSLIGFLDKIAEIEKCGGDNDGVIDAELR